MRNALYNYTVCACVLYTLSLLTQHQLFLYLLKMASEHEPTLARRRPQLYTGWPKKKYSSLIQYNLKIKRAITFKQEAFSSVMSNLNFGICHVYFNTVLAEIFGFKNK